jgi:hypothetical protein
VPAKCALVNEGVCWDARVVRFWLTGLAPYLYLVSQFLGTVDHRSFTHTTLARTGASHRTQVGALKRTYLIDPLVTPEMTHLWEMMYTINSGAMAIR